MVRALLVRVVAHDGRDELALVERRAVVHRDDADHVLRAPDDDGLEAAPFADGHGHAGERHLFVGVEGEVEDLSLGHDDELCLVDGVRTLAQDHALRAALTALREEDRHILELLRLDVGGERLRRRERRAVAREHVADLALRDRHERQRVDPILERHEVVKTAAQHVGLKACLAMERDEPRLDGPLEAPSLLDDPDAITRHVTDAGDREQK